MEWERPPAKRPRSPQAEAGAPPPRARPWNPREDVTLALLAERGCFDGDTDETRLSVLASLPGRTVAECRERWTYFVCPMRYGVAARTPRARARATRTTCAPLLASLTSLDA